jgi:uncharacterized membrane protein
MSLTQFLLTLHLLSIAMALGIGFSNLVGFRVAKTLGGDKALGIAAHRESLIVYGDIFFVLIIATGLGLLWAIGGGQGLSTWFHVKMGFVIIWAMAYILMRLRVRKFLVSRNGALVARIRVFAHMVIFAAAAALVCAVLAFAV